MPPFLAKIKSPIIGLSPMDGITDFPLRRIYQESYPIDLLFTEFINVRALIYGQPQVYEKLRYSRLEKPILCQLSGKEPKYFYLAAIVCCLLGFDGIDINLGCPSRTVVSSGGGSALIGQYQLVKEIIQAVKQGVKDGVKGYKLSQLPIKAKNKNKLKELIKFSHLKENKSKPIISIKTRTGQSRPMTKQWISFLLKQKLGMISLHGRTAKQGYYGQADWNQIKTAVKLADKLPTLILGNGDIKTQADILKRVKQSGVDGVLIGRGALGNPWIFKDLKKLKKLNQPQLYLPSPREKLDFMLKHALCFNQFYPKRFVALRKHFAWYSRGFKGAKELRAKLMKINNFNELKRIVI